MKMDAPLGVISVAGMYRTGKSYLLNRMLLNRSRGFDVGPTINACTKVSAFALRANLSELRAALSEKSERAIMAGGMKLRRYSDSRV